MNLFAFSGFLWAVTTLSLAIFVLRFGKTKFHRLWALFNFVVTIWAFGYGMAAISKDMKTAALWWVIAHIGANVNVVITLHAVCELGGLKRRFILIFGYFQAALFLVLAFTGQVDLNMQYLFNQFYYPRPSFYYIPALGINFPIFIYIWLIYLVYALFELYRVYRRAEGHDKKGSGWFLFAETTGFAGTAMYFLPIFGVMWYPYWNFTVPVYCILVTYAIFKHRMLDIEVIIKKTLVFAGLLASFFAMIILPTIIIQEYLFRGAGAGARMIGLAISGVIIIFTVRKIENFLINITNRYLFQKTYDYKELLKTFTSEVLTVLKIADLLNHTVDKLMDIIKLNSCAVLLFDNEKQQFDVKASRNIEDSSVTLVKLDSMVAFLEHTHGYILKKELIDKKMEVPEDIQEVMDKLSSELIIPMVLHDKMMGILSLGKKKSDENYSQDDLDILLPLARTLAIAISNAELFEELGKTQAEAAQKEKMAVIGTLSAGINHEICNPLGIARGQCEAFLLNMKDGLYKMKTSDELLNMATQIMSKVIRETDRAAAITKKLSSFAKPAKGEAEPVDIKKELDEVFGLVNYELKLEKIDIEKEIDEHLPRILVDRKQFQEVLFNLLRNAGQAIGEKGKITISSREYKEKVIINIMDTGAGIAEDKIKELFNPFFTTKDPGKGTGLGLFIVRQIVEKNNGRIYMKETKVGEGTTFTIEFPVLSA